LLCPYLWYPGFQGVHCFAERPSMRLWLPDRFPYIIPALAWSQKTRPLSMFPVWNSSTLRECTKMRWRLCARSWLARHPARIEITRSSGGSSDHTKISFFCKNHDFSRFLINFSTVVVEKHTHVVDPKRLTHIHSHRDLNSLSLSTDSTYLLVPMP
jgi:hypothetical protein